MKVLLFSLLVCNGATLPVVEIHVSTGDSLQRCSTSAMTAPTKCILSPGVHRTSIKVISLSNHLEITSTTTNNTVLTGLTPLSDLNWTVHRGSIYTARIPKQFVNIEQVFLDDNVWLSEARYPNLKNGGVNGVLNIFSWAFCGKGSHAGTCVDRADKWSDLSKFNTSMKGALATLSLGGRYATYTRKVKTHRAGSSHFTYDKDLGPGPGSKNTGSGNRYWLSGKLELLDSPGEWFIDTNTSMMYVWMPNHANPQTQNLSVKTKDYCIDVENQSGKGITLSNISLFGCTFQLRGCNSSNNIPCIVQDVNVTFPSYHRKIHLRDPIQPFSQGPPPNITLIEGDGAIVERLSIRYSNSVGIKVVGSHHRLSELLIEDTDWLATLDYPPVEIGFGIDQQNERMIENWKMYPRNPFGTNNSVSMSTIRNFGNAGIVTSQLSNTIDHCHVYNGGLLGSDDACIHADNSAAHCGSGSSTSRCLKHWHHNWVHDCLAKCMRGDDNTQNLTMSNNVIYNCGMPDSDGSGQSFGVVLKGDGNAFYSNTIFATKQNAVEFATGAEVKFHLKQSNTNSLLFNNVAHTWSGHQGPEPLGKQVHYKFGPVGQYTSGPIKKSYFANIQAMDFSPTSSSPLKGIGVAYPPLVPIQTAPIDAGAYQTGETPWRAGCSFTVQC